MAGSKFHALFSDIGGVAGTNGWDTALRLKIAKHFRCDLDDVQSRHRLMFDSYERGYLTFREYLERVFLGSPANFTADDLREYAYNESVAWPENIQLLRRVKAANNLKLAFISNEGEGLTEHRVKKFGLREAADFLVFSYFVHFRKPDPEIWRLALNLAQVEASQSIYIDDRSLFVDVARDLGFAAIQYVDLETTRNQLADLGLIVESGSRAAS